MAGQEEILDQGACCRGAEEEGLQGRRLVLGGKEVERGGLYRQVVEWACRGELHWALRGEECRMEEVGADRGDQGIRTVGERHPGEPLQDWEQLGPRRHMKTLSSQ